MCVNISRDNIVSPGSFDKHTINVSFLEEGRCIPKNVLSTIDGTKMQSDRSGLLATTFSAVLINENRTSVSVP